MTRKYGYFIEFLSKEVSPTGTKYCSGVGECLQKEMKASFDSFVKRHALIQKGNSKAGKLLDAKGNYIGDYHLSGNTIA